MKCKYCDVEITLPFAKMFCSHAHRAAYTNANRSTKPHKKHIYPSRVCKVSFCESCGCTIQNKRRKFCETCLVTYHSAQMKHNAETNGLGGHTSKNAIYYKSKQGFECYLQSSYEVKVAESLDENNIQWVRPKPMKWIDKNGVSHRYYPDFHLTEFNVYLDPKNNYLIIKDKDKITRVCEQNNVKILTLTNEQLTWDKIHSLILVPGTGLEPV